jgi:ZIP family zinc transporter
MVAAVIISNIPEGLSSSAGMRKAGRSTAFVIGLWTVMAVVFGLASVAGYAIFGALSPFVVAATIAVAGGAMLAMVADTMIPEAYAITHEFAGLITVAGFLTSFAITKLG